MKLLEPGLSWPLDTYLVQKFEGLAARGIEVTIAASRSSGSERVPLAGVNVLEQPHWSEERLEKSLVRLAGCQPDVIHFEWNSAAIQYMRLEPRWGCPTVISCHGSEVMVRPHRPGGAAFARALNESFNAATAVHCVSEAVASAAYGLGLERGKTHVIVPGVNTDTFKPASRRGSATRPLRIITVGTLRALKGHVYALQTLRRLLDAGVQARLELIGGHPAAALAEESERPRIEREIERLDLRDHVHVRNAIPPDAVRDALRTSDVLLHMSLSEGLSVAMLEAMSSGLPVVVTAAGGAAEAVTDGSEGYVVALRDTEAAAAALGRLAQDPALRIAMGAAGRRTVEERFSLARQLDQFEELYERLIAAAAQPQSGALRSARSR